MSNKGVIILAVRDFALPVPRVGSIESHSGYGRVPVDGQLVHQHVQDARAKDHKDYRAEVTMRHELEHGGFRFQISGRIDGLFEPEPPKKPLVEEIKSALQVGDLKKKLMDGPDTHPYCLQLKTYGYFYYLQHGIVPDLRFHLVSTRNFDSENLDLKLDVETHAAWVERRLDELVVEAKALEKRAKRRRRAAEEFQFPFTDPRPGQVELIETIEHGMSTKTRMLVQAPTGLGKTVGVLFPVMKEALARGQSVIYVTPKNSQHSVAEDAITRFQDTGTKVRGLTITAKSKICLKPEPICNPEFCEFAKDHYKKVAENDLPAEMAKKKSLNAKTFRELGETFQVCPFELQLEAARHADAVICDYNYVFSPRSIVARLGGASLGQIGLPNLVVDEAHNLAPRGMDYYSPSLSTIALHSMRPAMRELRDRFRIEGERALDDCVDTILGCRPPGDAKATVISPPVDVFLDAEVRLRSLLTRYLDSDEEIRPRDPILRLCNYWTEFTAALGFVSDPSRAEFFTTYQHFPPTGGTVRITCCDASEMLEKCYDEFDQVVGFSATLKPFEYYAKLSGLKPETIRTAEFQSPFPKKHRKLLIIPQISTKYSERARNYPKIAETIHRIVALKPGNYFAFFPSFEFLERVLEVFRTPEGFRIMRQERDSRAAAVEEVMSYLRARKMPTMVFAVQGGVFSEGVDYPGETVIGAFVVGPPLPTFDLERERMRDYYQERYGAGFDYAYAYPAMAKAVQAAGRVIRSETDRGIIVLMDNRFLAKSYAQSMPAGWFETDPAELVSSSILKEIGDFWRETNPPSDQI